MRNVKYQKIDPHAGPSDEYETSLTIFVYDVPNILELGFLPPLHIFNKILNGGGGDAGMSPSASWGGFQIDREEYNELCKELDSLDQLTLQGKAEWIYVKAKRAPEYDHILDRWEWLDAVAEKYRDDFFKEQEKNIAILEGGT
jgi:hypothetical protein